MKKTFKFFMCAIIMAVGFIGCSDEVVNNTGPVDPREGAEGEDAVVQLLVEDKKPSSYAYSQEYPALDKETLKKADINLYVFNDRTKFWESSHSLTLTDGKTNEFTLKSGDKRMYVIAKQDLDILSLGFTEPTTGTTYEDFEKQVIDASFLLRTAEDSITKISQDNTFLMGTLYGRVTSIQKYGKPGPEAQIIGPLVIGRLSSKAILTKVKYEIDKNKSSLKGAFIQNSAIYRLRSVPQRIHLIGQFLPAGGFPASGNHDVEIISYADEIDETATDMYKDYAWTKSLPFTGTIGADFTNVNKMGYYINENTNSKVAAKDARYGRTTYMQMAIQYKPSSEELYSLTGRKITGNVNTTTEKTFYTARVKSKFEGFSQTEVAALEPYKGRVLMFTGTPQADETHANYKVLDFASVQKFDSGWVFYNKMIADDKNNKDQMKKSVFRNHTYLLNVSEIYSLGFPTDIVPPEEIENPDYSIVMEVEVADWYQVDQGIVFE